MARNTASVRAGGQPVTGSGAAASLATATAPAGGVDAGARDGVLPGVESPAEEAAWRCEWTTSRCRALRAGPASCWIGCRSCHRGDGGVRSAVDVGRVINPDGVINQVEGGAVQSASWTLRERVRFDRARITSVNWDSYPVLRFTEVPEVAVRIVAAPGQPETGAGEIAQGPVAAAIGNALADATGVRVRDLPLTREQVIRAIESS